MDSRTLESTPLYPKNSPPLSYTLSLLMEFPHLYLPLKIYRFHLFILLIIIFFGAYLLFSSLHVKENFLENLKIKLIKEQKLILLLYLSFFLFFFFFNLKFNILNIFFF
jgi:hypothetical protein